MWGLINNFAQCGFTTYILALCYILDSTLNISSLLIFFHIMIPNVFQIFLKNIHSRVLLYFHLLKLKRLLVCFATIVVIVKITYILHKSWISHWTLWRGSPWWFVLSSKINNFFYCLATWVPLFKCEFSFFLGFVNTICIVYGGFNNYDIFRVEIFSFEKSITSK